jgi:hypothetical protein
MVIGVGLDARLGLSFAQLRAAARVAAAPDQMLQAVGYYGRAAAAPAAFARLSTGLDETIVRVITVRPGLEPVIQAMAALTPSLIRAASSAAE